jgi:Zn-dependent protease with chaperone function
MNDLYPAGPKNVPEEFTRPTNAYKKHAWIAVASLGLFMALYLALAGWFIWTAYRTFAAFGSGNSGLREFLVGSGAAFLAIFMLKALFFMKRNESTDLEITEAEHPRLFQFLYRLADDAGAPRPNRVFLSARVNASVFYDLSILNLLFPSRKNLEIGLALINVLSLSEIKAVLAHEFGHFAQRSMAIGSWVYIAQQIATHIVTKRDALDKFLKFLSGIDLRVAWIGWLLSLVVWSIRSLMDTLLSVVVLAQRALSRQMEFQADLVAVSLTGSDELVHALHKLAAADEAWDRTLRFTESEVGQKRVPHDIFAVHTRIIERVGEILSDESYGRVPQLAAAEPQSRRVFKSSFAQPPQMWSTHPANADREENAKRRYLAAPHDERSAWLLFDDVESLKQKVLAQLLRKSEATPTSAEETFRHLEQHYARIQYEARFRGAYLGRPLTRHAEQPQELYDDLTPQDAQKALSSLYPSQLSDDLAQLRDRSEERYALEALRDGVYQAAGGRIVYRGREISRRELPAAIQAVREEEKQIEQRILAHDRLCRGVHLALAGQLGGGWKEYLIGLIHSLHYAEHALADLRDAQGLFRNIFAVVTADGKVSKRELKRLVNTANELHGVLARIYSEKVLKLDSTLCERLGVSSWSELLGELKLPPATSENIDSWLGAIDGWVEGTAGSLSALSSAALEQLLTTEDDIARRSQTKTAVEEAPQPTRVPLPYATLLPGNERKRQKRLGWWDRFMVADGLIPAFARLLVAGVIVGAVLGFGGTTGTVSTLAVYNGLGVSVRVAVGGERISVSPFSSSIVEVELNEGTMVEAKTADGTVIERFNPPLSKYAQRYVYNVAGASPLVEWVAVYGSAKETPPRFLGAPRWTTTSAEILFQDPPQSISSKGAGGTRSVLSGVGARPPSEVLELISDEMQRKQVIMAHAKWDAGKTEYASVWQEMAKE